MVAGDALGVGNELAFRVIAVERRERRGVAREECGVWDARGAVAAGGACYPDKVTAGVRYEKEALRRSAKMELDEVLASAGG